MSPRFPAMRLFKGTVVLLLVFLSAILIQVLRKQRDAGAEASLPVHGQVEGFTLTERDGQEFSSISLMGRVWIADFIFTRCASTCPQMTAQMARMADSLRAEPELRFVSFTVDPSYDSPSVLTRYAEAHGADRFHWLFLTGSRDLIYRLARGSFHLGVEDVGSVAMEGSSPSAADSVASVADSMAVAAQGHEDSMAVAAQGHEDSIAIAPGGQGGHGAAEPFIHSTRFVLVDREGRIRGYYDSTDKSRIAELYADTETLLREPSSPPAPSQL